MCVRLSVGLVGQERLVLGQRAGRRERNEHEQQNGSSHVWVSSRKWAQYGRTGRQLVVAERRCRTTLGRLFVRAIDQVVLAYATTVRKAQGCEYSAVVIPATILTEDLADGRDHGSVHVENRLRTAA